jgi:hypothetical protein
VCYRGCLIRTSHARGIAGLDRRGMGPPQHDLPDARSGWTERRPRRHTTARTKLITSPMSRHHVVRIKWRPAQRERHHMVNRPRPGRPPWKSLIDGLATPRAWRILRLETLPEPTIWTSGATTAARGLTARRLALSVHCGLHSLGGMRDRKSLAMVLMSTSKWC